MSMSGALSPIHHRSCARVMSHLDADALAALHHVDPQSPLAATLSAATVRNFAKTQLPQTSHRIQIVEAWNVDIDGMNVLEIGCGQGDASVVLASAVGQGQGSVTAWDPADPDYGSPLTVGQAQENLKSKPQLQNLKFRLGCPLADILDVEYDIAVLLHCIYYFPSADILSKTLIDLHPQVDTICIAEYALETSLPAQQPHLLAILAQQALEALKPVGRSQSNVQTVLSPRAIVALADTCGWSLIREQTITPHAALQDGKWEVGTVYNRDWMDEVDMTLKEAGDDSGRHRAHLAAAQDAVIAAVDRLGSEGTDGAKGMSRVRTMDVWCAVFRRKIGS